MSLSARKIMPTIRSTNIIPVVRMAQTTLIQFSRLEAGKVIGLLALLGSGQPQQQTQQCSISRASLMILSLSVSAMNMYKSLVLRREPSIEWLFFVEHQGHSTCRWECTSLVSFSQQYDWSPSSSSSSASTSLAGCSFNSVALLFWLSSNIWLVSECSTWSWQDLSQPRRRRRRRRLALL